MQLAEVSEDGHEPTTVPITTSRGVLPLQNK